jgi:hypothetical protein
MDEMYEISCLGNGLRVYCSGGLSDNCFGSGDRNLLHLRGLATVHRAVYVL